MHKLKLAGKPSLTFFLMLIVLFVSTCLLITVTSNADVAYAVDSYGLYMAGVQVTSENLTGTNWSYDPDTNTLTLNDYVFYNQAVGAEHYAPIYYTGSADFNIVYTGSNNYIRATSSAGNIVAGIYSAANLTISGGYGNLAIEVNKYDSVCSYGIQVLGKLTINSGSMSIITGDASNRSIGIYCQNGTSDAGLEFNANYLRIEPGINGTEHAYGVYNEGSAVIQAGTFIIKAKSSGSDAYAYYGSNEDSSLNVKSVVESFEIASYTSAIGGDGGKIKNNIPGSWYTDAAGSENKTAIEKSNSPIDYPSAKKITLKTPYMKVDETQPDCVYDGKPHSPVISVEEPTTGYTIKFGEEYGVCEDDEAPSFTDAGEYTVYYQITADGYMTENDSISFVIQQAEWNVLQEPTAKTDLKYTGEPLELVTPGIVEGATMYYTVLDSNYNYVVYYVTDIPTATEVGTYQVYYEVPEEDNYELYEDIVTVTIAKGDIVLDKDPTAIDNLVYSAQAQNLIEPGSIQGKTIYYKLGEDGEYSENIPSATEVGIYTIYYKVDGDENYNDFESSLNAEISKLYLFDSFVWADDYSSAQAKLIASDDSTDTKLVPATVNNQVLKDPTCEDKGTTRYTATYSTEEETVDIENINALGHTLVHHTAVAATCTTDGTAEYYSCSVCEKKFSDEDGKTEIQNVQTIAALGHNWNNGEITTVATCQTKGVVTKTCLRTGCNETITEETDYAAHSLTHHNEVAATTEATGNIEYWTCSICDQYFSDNQGLHKITQEDVIIAKLKKEIQDPASGVSIEINGDDSDRGFAENVNLKVEVKTNLSIKEGTTDYASIQNLLSDNEKIAGVYDVKLILTVNGVETEIQPSDIKEGTTITVKMDIPDDVNSTEFRLLHIHSVNDMEFINNYTVENDAISFTINRLSEFAFIVNSSSQNGSKGAGFPSWAIALIVIGGVLVLGCICFLLLFFVLNKWIRKDDKAVRAFKVGKKDDEIKLMLMNFSIEYRVKEEVFDSKKEAEDEENSKEAEDEENITK